MDLLRLQKEQQQQQEEHEAQLLSQEVIANRPKVEARQEQLQLKIQKEKEKAAALEAREEKKLEFLMELASQVGERRALQRCALSAFSRI